MNKLDKIKKLRAMTQKNGASEGEEDSAARAIGRMLMEDDALIVGDGSQPGVPFHVGQPWQQPHPWQQQQWFYETMRRAAEEQYRAQTQAMRNYAAQQAAAAEEIRRRYQNQQGSDDTTDTTNTTHRWYHFRKS